jgi:hypothetical protein
MDAPPALIAQFLAWLDAAPRSYAKTMEAWRTSCPRLTVWEDAVDAGLVAVGTDGIVRRARQAVEPPPAAADDGVSITSSSAHSPAA